MFGALTVPSATWAQTRAADSIESLQRLSIEELANLRVTPVSKILESLHEAPAAVCVIAHDDIICSGARWIPDMLRLAPNLEVFQTSWDNYVITARGLSGSSSAQNFSNKIEVLIDGRSVYSSLYSGVYWDMQNVLPENIDRIEVISGPSATLWGGNAVNGVVNIITRNSGDTQGGLPDLRGANFEDRAAAQYGGMLPDPAVPAYVELDSRLAWHIFPKTEIAVSGMNLLHAHHQEWTIPPADEIPRMVFLELQQSF